VAIFPSTWGGLKFGAIGIALRIAVFANPALAELNTPETTALPDESAMQQLHVKGPERKFFRRAFNFRQTPQSFGVQAVRNQIEGLFYDSLAPWFAGHGMMSKDHRSKGRE
jgi:hypothetical protein